MKANYILYESEGASGVDDPCFSLACPTCGTRVKPDHSVDPSSKRSNARCSKCGRVRMRVVPESAAPWNETIGLGVLQ